MNDPIVLGGAAFFVSAWVIAVTFALRVNFRRRRSWAEFAQAHGLRHATGGA